MVGKFSTSQHSESFEYMLLEEDPDNLRPVVATTSQSNTLIHSTKLKLHQRIGRGPCGEVWIATYHQPAEDFDRYHEVAVKMLYPVKDDQVQTCLIRSDEMLHKCRGLENVCFLHGVSLLNGRLCFVMKYYEASIWDKMARQKGGKLPLSDVIRYGVNLAQGILGLHERGIATLNLKPSNFLLDINDHVVVGDFGIPFLLLGVPLPSSDLVRRLGTPNYMAPEQWEPSIRGPISFESDSWGFGCSILEMLSGIQPWRGKSADEIYQSVTIKKEKPKIPSGLPPELKNILHGCFEHDLRKRPMMADILHALKSCESTLCRERDSDTLMGSKPNSISYTEWYLLKDHLQVGDTVHSRFSKNCCKPKSMEIPGGTIVGKAAADNDDFILVRVHGVHNPLRVHCSTVERVTFGFAAGDWVRVMEDEKHTSVGILHSIDRDGRVTVGLIGMDTLWVGHYSDLQMAESYFVGQFLRLKATVYSPRFVWLRKRGGAWATGRISDILPNGCLVVKFPGRFSYGEANIYLADPSEVEIVSFSTCEGLVKKYEHLEDFHWAVRPFIIAFGLFAALKMGLSVGKSIGRSRKRASRIANNQGQKDEKQQDAQIAQNASWLPPLVTSILSRFDLDFK